MTVGTVGIVIIGFIVFIFLFVYIAAAIRIIRPYEKGVVERLGKYQRTFEPGLHIIIPFLDRVTKADMRENVVDVPPQEVITKDNVVVTVDAVVYYEATDPVKLIYNVANFYVAATKLAQTNLRNVIGEMQLDESLTSREKINAALRQILDDATDKWGVRVVRVELHVVGGRRQLVADHAGDPATRLCVAEADGRHGAVAVDLLTEACERHWMGHQDSSSITTRIPRKRDGTPPALLGSRTRMVGTTSPLRRSACTRTVGYWC